MNAIFRLISRSLKKPPKLNSQQMASIQSYVDDTINSNKVVVFSATYCPYCTKAKNALKNYKINNIKVIELDVEKNDEFDAIVSYLEKKTGAATVPRVFINKKFIGGGDDTARLHQTGELKKLLEEANAI